MPATEKVLVLADLARSVYGQWRFQRLVSGMIVVTALIVITSMLVCTLLLGGFYAAYLSLLANGMETQDALLLTAGLVVLTALLFAAITVMYLRKLRDMPRQLFGNSRIGARASDAVDAFFDGLMGEDA